MNTFGVGELVRVLEDMDSVKRLQAGHGEWTDSMTPVCSFSLIILTCCFRSLNRDVDESPLYLHLNYLCYDIAVSRENCLQRNKYLK